MIGHDYLLVVVPIPILSLLHVSLLPYFFYFFVLVLIFFVPLSSPFSLIPSTPPRLLLSLRILRTRTRTLYLLISLSLKHPSPLTRLSPSTPPPIRICLSFIYNSKTKKQPLCPLSPAPLAAIFLFQPSSHSSNCTLRYKGT